MPDPTTPRPVPMVPGDLFARHQTITGLRALADFLETHPDVPVNEYGQDFIVLARTGDDTSSAALVDQTAAVLEEPVTDERDQGGHYRASRMFGRIAYSIVHIPDRARRAHHARNSYAPNVIPDHNDTGHDGAERAA
ncbi:hypothetical protein [Spirillospora albida]|uniref:hypothetical protein n=1 Tax=Spirillospora albida TaxID=58123 RepID=UPI0004C0DDD6|nr:hypothetical protein [Spirillospora albida]